MTPYYIGQPYTTIGGEDGQEEYFHCLYLLGYNDIQVRDISMGIYKLSANDGTEGVSQDDYETPLSTDLMNGKPALLTGSKAHFDPKQYNIQLEIQQGENEVSLYDQKVVQNKVGTELTNGEDRTPVSLPRLVVNQFSAKYPHKVEVEIQFNGLCSYKDDGTRGDATTKVGIQMSVDGGTTWIPFANFTGCTSTENTDDMSVSVFTKSKNEMLRYVASREFTWEEINSWNNGEGLKNNIIEFRFQRVNPQTQDSNTLDKVAVTYVRTWCYDPKLSEKEGRIVKQAPMVEKYRNMTARLGFSIKAGEDIQGQLNSINCILTSKARIWDKENQKWTKETYPTDNPASLSLLALTGKFRGEGNSYIIDDTGDEPTCNKLDLLSFGQCYEECEEEKDFGGVLLPKYACDGAVLKDQKSLDLANNILATCRSNIVLIGNKYCVVMDTPRDNPVMVLNNQNVLEASNTKTFDDVPDGFMVKYVSALNDYQEDTMLVVPNDKLDIPESELRLQNIELLYVTNPYRAKALALYRLACLRLRPETWTRKVATEGNLIEVGSMVKVQDDTISVGIGEGGEILELIVADDEIVGIKTDGLFTVTDYTQQYGVLITQADGFNNPVVIKRKVLVDENKVYSTLYFETPISLDENLLPSVGDICTFGFFDRESIDALCLGKKDFGDGTFELTLVPYDEGIYNADTGFIADFDSKVTPPQDVGSSVPAGLPTASIDDVNRIVEKYVGGTKIPEDVSSLEVIARKDGLLLKAEVDEGSLANSPISFVYQLKKGDGEYYDIETINDEYIFDRKVDGYPEKTDLDTWKIRAKVKNIYDEVSENWIESTIDTGDYGSWKFDFASNNINVDVVDRTAILNMTVSKRSGTKEIYGDTRFKIQIKRIGYVIDGGSGLDTPVSIEDSAYFKPELYKTCYPQGVAENGDYNGNENNYKAEEGGFFDSPNRYSQSLPLYGQEKYQYVFSSDAVNWYADEGMTVPFELPAGVEPKRVATSNKYYILTGKHIQNTSYMYSIVAYNESGFESENPVEIMITAMCTSIRDIVYAHTYYKNLYVEKLSAINANIGMISQGGFGEFSNWTNFWALSTLSAEEAGTQNDVIGGSFRVGDNKEYIMVIPAHSTVGGITNNTDTAMIKIKAGNITLTTSGTEFNSGTYIYDENDENKRLLLSADGITIEAFRDGQWVTVGQFTVDKSGNLLLTNSIDKDNLPQTGIEVNNVEIYHFDSTLVTETGTDPLEISVSEGYTFNGSDSFIRGTSVVGDIEFNIKGLDKQITVLNKASAIRIGNSYLYSDGHIGSNFEGLDKSNWGLPQEVYNLFKKKPANQ